MYRKQIASILTICVLLFGSGVVAQQDKKPLTNEDIVKMVKAELPEDTIILVIQKSPNRFDTSPDALIALKEAGATKKVLDALVKSQDSPTSPEKAVSRERQQEIDRFVKNLENNPVMRDAHAEDLAGKKRYAEAIQIYNELIADAPSDCMAYVGRGKVRFMMGSYQDAIRDYNVCLRLNNDEGGYYGLQAYQLRGNAKLELQDYRGAIADYNQFIRLYTGLVNDEAARKANGGGGVNLLLILLEKPELQSEIYSNRGIAKAKLGDNGSACEDFREACKLGNKSACATSRNICNSQIIK